MLHSHGRVLGWLATHTYAFDYRHATGMGTEPPGTYFLLMGHVRADGWNSQGPLM